MYESISKNNELENEMTLDMSYFWYSDDASFHLSQGLLRKRKTTNTHSTERLTVQSQWS